MRSSTSSAHNASTATYNYSPAVPLSVYRELAAELQAVEAMLDSLDAQNQQLAKQNQQLRQEIEKAVQSVVHLKQVADSVGADGWNHVRPTSDFRPRPPKPAPGARPMHRPRPPSGVQMFTEQEQGRYRRRSQLETASQTNGWWLAITILLIMVTAFSAGYLLVRPLLQNR